MFELIRLAIPVTLSQLAVMCMGFVDLHYIGQTSPAALAAVGLGTSLANFGLLILIGLISGLDYFAPYELGRKDAVEADRYFKQTLVLATLASVPVLLGLFAVAYGLGRFGVNPEVLPGAQRYLQITAIGILPNLLFIAVRQYLQAHQWTTAAVVTMVLANVLNWQLNRVWVPVYGVEGSAYATLVSRLGMLVAICVAYWVWSRKRSPELQVETSFSFVQFWDPARLQALWKLGVPAGMQMGFEVGIFSTATLLSSRLLTVESAAHQVVLNIASTTFMVPLGISLATAVVVGRKKGEGRIDLACQAGWNGVLLGTGIMALLGGVLLIFPNSILSVYTQDIGVLAVATKLLWVAGIFQVADGMQVTLSGALRGFGNTRASMGFNGIGHWLVGFPAMVVSLWIFERGVQGIWVSLCAGLFVVATGLLWAWDRETHEKSWKRFQRGLNSFSDDFFSEARDQDPANKKK